MHNIMLTKKQKIIQPYKIHPPQITFFHMKTDGSFGVFTEFHLDSKTNAKRSRYIFIPKFTKIFPETPYYTFCHAEWRCWMGDILFGGQEAVLLKSASKKIWKIQWKHQKLARLVDFRIYSTLWKVLDEKVLTRATFKLLLHHRSALKQLVF